MTKYELEIEFEKAFDKNTYTTGGGYGADSTSQNGLYTDFLQSVIEFSKSQAISFAEWIQGNGYVKHKNEGWYKAFTRREDFPAGFSMSSTSYENITIEELHLKYVQSKEK